MEANGAKVHTPPPRELETLLSEDEKSKAVVKKFSFTKDVESADYDPFAERKLDNPTSNMDTLAHLLKASLGTGILAMPKAFQCVGMISGILFTILVAVVCTHCSYILIKCAHVLYGKSKTTTMTFPEVAEAAFKYGPRWVQRWSYAFRVFIVVSLFVTYFGTCSVYTVIIADNISPVVEQYVPSSQDIDKRIYIICLLPPLIFMTWIRNLKYLAPISMIANVFMGLGLGITVYYLVGTGPITLEDKNLWTSPSQWAPFFSTAIFAMEAIGVVMPLENAMKTPKAILGYCGILNKGMTGVTIVYILLGFLGYLKYGEGVKDVITVSLHPTEIPAQIVKVAIALAVYCTFGLQFFVCVDIMWQSIKDRFSKRQDLADYIMRTVMTTVCVLLAIAVPQIGPLLGVIGAFCFSILGLIAPAFIEVITFWDIGFGPGKYLIWKNILVTIFGLLALIFGTKDAIIKIIDVYST